MSSSKYIYSLLLFASCVKSINSSSNDIEKEETYEFVGFEYSFKEVKSLFISYAIYRLLISSVFYSIKYYPIDSLEKFKKWQPKVFLTFLLSPFRVIYFIVLHKYLINNGAIHKSLPLNYFTPGKFSLILKKLTPSRLIPCLGIFDIFYFLLISIITYFTVAQKHITFIYHMWYIAEPILVSSLYYYTTLLTE